MRADMHKIIVERPRFDRGTAKALKGTHRQARKRGRYGNLEELPFVQRVEKTKSLSDNLAPLRRFFHKSVGRPWNKVHSELSKVAGRGMNPVNNHIFQHIEDMVPTNVVLGVDGPYMRTRWGSLYKLRPNDMYVHPDTGLICIVKSKRREPPEDKRTIVGLSDRDYAIKLDGIWFKFGMAVYAKRQIHDAPKVYRTDEGGPVGIDRTYVEIRDAHLGYQPSLSRLQDFYKKWWRADSRVYAVSKVRMEPGELKKLGLKNTPEEQATKGNLLS